MGIMKYFIRKRKNKYNNLIHRSALILMSALALFTQSVYAAEKTNKESADSTLTARKVFEKINSPGLEILSGSTRLDMLDYWDVDSVYKALNVMEGLSWLDTVTPTYLKVHVTNVSTFEIKLLPAKAGNIIMTIHTVGNDVQAQDSQVKFYDGQLKELETSRYLVMPQVKDFFTIPKGSTTKMKEIEEMIPFPTIAFTANPKDNVLEARLTVEKYMNEDDWNIAKLFAKPYIVLDWKKEKYKY